MCFGIDDRGAINVCGLEVSGSNDLQGRCSGDDVLVRVAKFNSCDEWDNVGHSYEVWHRIL